MGYVNPWIWYWLLCVRFWLIMKIDHNNDEGWWWDEDDDGDGIMTSSLALDAKVSNLY